MVMGRASVTSLNYNFKAFNFLLLNMMQEVSAMLGSYKLLKFMLFKKLK
jgi:hypothetical protein